MVIIDVQVRDSSLALVGPLEGFTGGQLILRDRDVGAWNITVPGPALPPGDLRDALFAGGGLVFSDGHGHVLQSGPLTSRPFERSEAKPFGEWSLSGESDERALTLRGARPSPATAITAAVSAQPGTGDSGYDVRTGTAEELILGYVEDNAGPSAIEARRIAGLVMDPNPDPVGATLTEQARMETLLELCQRIATVGGVGFRVVQVGTELRLQVFERVDRTGTAQFTFDAGTLRGLAHSQSAPKGTHAIVRGSGDGEFTAWVEVTTAESLQAMADWGGQRVELLVERADTNDPDLLAQAGVEALAGAAAVGSVKADPVDTEQLEFPRDYGLGDLVRVYDPSGLDVDDAVREVVIGFTPGATRARPVVGPPNASDTPETYRRLRELERVQRRNAAR